MIYHTEHVITQRSVRLKLNLQISFFFLIGKEIHLINRFVLYLCRVLGQVSCELVSPKLNRATEGILFFNLELSQMAAPAFEPGRYLNLFLKLF